MPTNNSDLHLAIDIGGTFTDVVEWDGEKLIITKADTTIDDLSDGVLAAMTSFGHPLERIRHILHGTTVVINSLLEEKGARTALVTTKGFRDVYEIARGSRYEAYDFLFERRRPFVHRRHRYEVAERMSARGISTSSPDRAEVSELARQIMEDDIEAVAVCLINSYVNGEHERFVGQWLREMLPGVSVTVSCDLAREWREFERTSTAVMNAFAGRRMHAYLERLESRLSQAGFMGVLLMTQANGGSMSVESAKSKPLALVESGPACGVVGAAKLAHRLGLEKAVAFDMGGTTAKASLVAHGSVTTTRPYFVGRSGQRSERPSLLPVVDLVEIGAGGGSLAKVRETGGLRVGPESAGAFPGPVAYGRGGENVTVTDANLVLGRLNPDAFLGGSVRLDLEKAREVMNQTVAKPLDLTETDAAWGIIELVNNAMALAVRQVSLQRGEDPRKLSLIAFGGAGPTHAVDIAKLLQIPTVLIPPAPENFSALGMLMSDMKREATATVAKLFDELDVRELLEKFQSLEDEVREVINRDAPAALNSTYDWIAELRYVGQEEVLSIPVAPADRRLGRFLDSLRPAFHEAHQTHYGFSVQDEPIQFVNISVWGNATLDLPSIEELTRELGNTSGVNFDRHHERNRKVHFGRDVGFLEVPVFQRRELTTRQEGPLIVQEYGATIIVPPKATARLGELGCLFIEDL